MTDRLGLQIVIEQAGPVAIACLRGPIDSETIESFQHGVGPLCSPSGARVLIDFVGVTYINSRGIGLLMKYHRGLLVSRGQLALCALNSKLVRTLDLLQIGKALNIYPTRDEALAALK